MRGGGKATVYETMRGVVHARFLPAVYGKRVMWPATMFHVVEVLFFICFLCESYFFIIFLKISHAPGPVTTACAHTHLLQQINSLDGSPWAVGLFGCACLAPPFPRSLCRPLPLSGDRRSNSIAYGLPVASVMFSPLPVCGGSRANCGYGAITPSEFVVV